MSYFPKIDQNEFPVTKKEKLLLKNNNKSKKISSFDKKIINEIINFTNSFKKQKFFGGTWEWVDKEKRNDFNQHFEKKNYKNISALFSNFFRNPLSFGLISSHWDQNNKKSWKKKLTSDILKNVASWEEFTKNSNKDFEFLKANKKIGNPYGLSYKNQLILFDTPRHDYYANKIEKLIKKSKSTPIIFEIGGGYGGLVSQLIKRKIKFKYINVDLFRTLPVAYYFLKKSFKTDIVIKSFVDKKVLKKNDFIFIPYYGQNFWKTNSKIDVLFNSNSFSEMGKKTLFHYFKIINKKIKPDYIMHQNTNISSFKKLKKYGEIPSSKFPIDYKNYSMINFCVSIFQGGSGRYREFLFKRKN